MRATRAHRPVIRSRNFPDHGAGGSSARASVSCRQDRKSFHQGSINSGIRPLTAVAAIAGIVAVVTRFVDL